MYLYLLGIKFSNFDFISECLVFVGFSFCSNLTFYHLQTHKRHSVPPRVRFELKIFCCQDVIKLLKPKQISFFLIHLFIILYSKVGYHLVFFSYSFLVHIAHCCVSMHVFSSLENCTPNNCTMTFK